MKKRRSPEPAGQGSLFGSRFEHDFLIRTLGDVVRVPDTSLSELVANAWDAGASRVDVTIPEQYGEALTVCDDGCGLTQQQFADRWMSLAYDRLKHQGGEVEFPPGRSGQRRPYGRNGQGRHGLLCFADEYEVETTRDGMRARFRVHTGGAATPLESRLLEERKAPGHGVTLTVKVARHLPSPDRIREVLSTRFLHDPEFRVVVNGSSLELTELTGVEEDRVEIVDPETKRKIVLHLYVVQGDAGRAKRQSGVAFWVSGRLVGEPGWSVLGKPILDGRTVPGRRTTIVVSSADLHEEVLPDWSGFRTSEVMRLVAAAVVEHVDELLARTYAQRIDETARDVLVERLPQLEALDPGAQREVTAITRAITKRNPLVPEKVLAAAVEGVMDVKKEATVQALLQRVHALPEADQQGLARLLDEWSVRDALTVLDEVGKRIRAVEALQKLMGDKTVDELHVLHPLVAQARWLFGPEYDSPHYSYNLGLRNAVEKVFGAKPEPGAFANPKRRPDLLVRPDGTVAAVASEDFDPETNIARLRRVLLVELKKGGFRIGREEMNQASGYVEDLFNSGHLVGTPFIQAFVVGHELDPLTTSARTIGDSRGRVEAWTYASLVATANARLFRVRDHVTDRYPESAQGVLDHLRAKGFV